MFEKEIIIPLADLERIEITCPKCHRSITFLATENKGFPTTCKTCNEALASGIELKWTAWKTFLGEGKEAQIQFRVKR
jgi:hypothetical protein